MGRLVENGREGRVVPRFETVICFVFVSRFETMTDFYDDVHDVFHYFDDVLHLHRYIVDLIYVLNDVCYDHDEYQISDSSTSPFDVLTAVYPLHVDDSIRQVHQRSCVLASRI